MVASLGTALGASLGTVLGTLLGASLGTTALGEYDGTSDGRSLTGVDNFPNAPNESSVLINQSFVVGAASCGETTLLGCIDGTREGQSLEIADGLVSLLFGCIDGTRDGLSLTLLSVAGASSLASATISCEGVWEGELLGIVDDSTGEKNTAESKASTSGLVSRA
jgi:hypothetical protein